MNILSLKEASRYPFAPSQPYLSKLAKSEDRPDFFIRDAYGWKVNGDSPKWLEYLKKRQAKAESAAPKGTPQPQEPVDIEQVSRSMAELQRAKLEEDITKLEIGNQHAQLKLENVSEDLIDFDLAESIFTGYLDAAEKASTEGTEALREDLRDILSDAIESGDADEAAALVVKAITRKSESAIKQAKHETREALERRRAEEETK